MTQEPKVECHEGEEAAERFTAAMRSILSVPSDRAAEIRASVKSARPEQAASPSVRRTSGGDQRSESGRAGTDRSPSRPAR